MCTSLAEPTGYRKAMISRSTCALNASRLGLSPCIMTGGSHAFANPMPSMVGEVYEAVLGAILEDCNFNLERFNAWYAAKFPEPVAEPAPQQPAPSWHQQIADGLLNRLMTPALASFTHTQLAPSIPSPEPQCEHALPAATNGDAQLSAAAGDSMSPPLEGQGSEGQRSAGDATADSPATPSPSV